MVSWVLLANLAHGIQRMPHSDLEAILHVHSEELSMMSLARSAI